MQVTDEEFGDARGNLAFSHSLREMLHTNDQQQQQMPQPKMQAPQQPFQAMPNFQQKQGPLDFQRSTTEIPQTLQAPEEEYDAGGVKFSRKDVDNTFRPTLFGEVSNRPEDKQEMEARVILSTALNRMREYSKHGLDHSLDKVLSMPNQYQAYGGKQFNLYKEGGTEADTKKKTQIDAIVDKILQEIKGGEFKDITNNAFYYKHNPDESITYDDTKSLFR